jgi:hypothetical protein
MKQKFFISFLIVLLSLPLFAGDYKIGTGTSTEYYVPMYGYANYNWSKTLYTNAELQAQGMTTATTIKKIAFYVSNVTSYQTLNQTIYMGYNYNTVYSTGLTSYPSSYTGYTQVYSGTIQWTGTGWFEITLQTPYTYDPASAGTPSLEILWENRDATALSPYPKFNYTSASNMCVYKSGTTYPTLTGGTRYSNRPNIWFMSDPTAIPPVASPMIPTIAATSIEINTNLKWQHNGGQPDYYKVYLGTNNPPTNVVNGDIITINTFDYSGYLKYGTTYYWTIIPHNSFGDATNCPVWNFMTRDDPIIYSFPWTENFDGTFPNTNWIKLHGELVDPVVVTPAGDQWRQDDWLNVTSTDKAAVHELYSSMNGWLVTPPLNITSNNFQLQFDLAFLKWDQPVTTPPALTGTDDRFVVLIGDGFSWSTSNILREWNNSGSTYILNNIATAGQIVSIPLPASRGAECIAFFVGSTTLNADNDIQINNLIVKEEVDLPVELSSFTAITLDATTVSVQWVSQSETDMLGYNVYRNTTPDMVSANLINSQIVAATNTSQAYTYSLHDSELTPDTIYFYWLESIDLDGSNAMYGPVSLFFHVGDIDTPNPNIPNTTTLFSAYPNPFNPQTTIHYNMKDAGTARFVIVNSKGQLIKEFSFSQTQPGHFQFAWDGTDMYGRDVASGVYYYSMNCGKYTSTKKMILLK